MAIDGGPLVAGPRFAGADVVRLTEGARGALWLDRYDVAGRPTAAPLATPGDGDFVGWDASSSLAALDRGHFTGLGRQGLVRDFENLDILAGGSLQRVLTCSREQADNALGFGVDGDRIAYVRNSCRAYAPADVVIKDFASGAESVVTVNRAVTQVALAGDHLAIGGPVDSNQSPAFYLNGSSEFIAVYDWRTARLLHAFQPVDSGNRPLVITGFDVQADGKVAFSGGFESGCPDVGWFRAGDEAVHQLPICASAGILGSGIKIAGDRIAVSAGAPDSSDARRRYELLVSDLSGNTTIVANGYLDPPSQFRDDIGSAFDFDGSRVAFAGGECDQTRDAITIADLEPPVHAVRDRQCPVQIVRRSVRLTRSGAVSFEILCPEGCRPVNASLLLNQSFLASHPLSAQIRRGERRRVSVKLYPRRFRRVKRDGRIRLDIRLFVPTSHGTTASQPSLTGVVLRWPPGTSVSRVQDPPA